jgi:anti-anti-sigma factor
MPEAKILMSRDGNVVRFKVVGIGTFQTAVGFKATYTELLADGATDFILDLEECEILDSTFLGTILGLALKVRQSGVGRVHVIKPNEIVRSLFRGTGLDQIFDMNDPGGGKSCRGRGCFEVNGEREADRATVIDRRYNCTGARACAGYLRIMPRRRSRCASGRW